MASTSESQKRRGRPKSDDTGPATGLRLSPELREALDKAVADDNKRGSRSELIRSIVAEWLRKRGYLPAGRE